MSLTVFILALLILWLVAAFILSGPNLSKYDQPVGELFDGHPDDVEHNQAFLARLQQVRNKAMSMSPLAGLHYIRDFADNLSADLESDCAFTPTCFNGVSGEWIVTPGADPKRRVLFFHGGAFILGSAKGHRRYGHELSKIANAAVLSVNYKMLPEYRRGVANKEAQEAYRWILENGPNGVEQLNTLIVSGDSAGGNIALMISGWSKSQNNPTFLRKPDGVVVFSPNTDLTMRSPTIKAHRHSDPILGEGLGMLSKIPAPIAVWLGLLLMRVNPGGALNSPVFGNLADLPPTLIQASSTEMLLGESVRYTNKANEQGSDVRLQIWQNEIHDWQLFSPDSGSAKEAMAKVREFIDQLDNNASTQTTLSTAG